MTWLDDPIQGADARPNAGTIINPGSAQIPGGLGLVSPAGILDENAIFPFNISGTVDYTMTGLVVAQDTTAANTVKLTAAGNTVFGRAEMIESRTTFGLTVASVAIRGGLQFPLDPLASGATIPVIGGSVIGGTTAGTVMALAAAANQKWTVTAVDTVNLVVTVVG